jgi:hypothetical protein
MENKRSKTTNLKFNPLLTGLICGLYPLTFYYSNNFPEINTWEHFGYFSLIFIGIPLVIFILLSAVFKLVKPLEKYKWEILFVTIIMTVATLMSFAMYLTLKKKILLGILILAAFAAWKWKAHYPKLLVLILLMAVLPVIKCAMHIIDHQHKLTWLELPDAIKDVKFVETPNVYLIQPDGYVGKDIMEAAPYSFDNPFYDWLETEGFKRYDNFRSNYPASLTSNSSLLAMKQHQFGKTFTPKFEMPHAREVIAGNNSAIEIFKNNGYKNFFIVQDEYFQQSFPDLHYDYYNIHPDEIPYFSNGSMIKKVVIDDLKAAIDTTSLSGPRFFFVERLLPHHVHFAASKEEERDTYIEKIKDVNTWLKEAIGYISQKDPEAIIIILADHGGWVGLNSYPEMFSTNDPQQIKSIYSSLAAIKWNGHLVEGMDSELTSSVNLFRVLFSVLGKNPEYLKYLEDNSSYNLQQGMFSKSVRAVIDDGGNVIAN